MERDEQDKVTIRFSIDPVELSGEVSLPASGFSKVMRLLALEFLQLEPNVAIHGGTSPEGSGLERDFLTGLVSQGTAETLLHRDLSAATERRDPLCIVLADIDQLDKINQEQGRAFGDRVLYAVGQRLRENLRGSDWAARWHDDSFLLTLFATPAALERITERIFAPLKVDDVKVKLSFAYAQVRSGDDARSLIRRTEQALNRVKREAFGDAPEEGSA